MFFEAFLITVASSYHCKVYLHPFIKQGIWSCGKFEIWLHILELKSYDQAHLCWVKAELVPILLGSTLFLYHTAHMASSDAYGRLDQEDRYQTQEYVQSRPLVQ